MRRVARGLTPSQQLPPSPEPNGVLAMVSVLYSDECTPVKYIEGARRLASALPPPWALWIAATAGVQRSVAFQRLLAGAPNVHIVRVDGKAEVKNARRQSCSFDATLLRFLLLDDPRLAVGVVVDLDIDDGKKAAQRFVSLAIWAMHTGKRWCVHQYPCHPRPRGGARVVPVGASGTPGPSCRFVERRSPLVRDGEHCLQTHPDVEVFATEHKWGGLLPAPPTKPRPCRFGLSELDGGLTGAGDPSVERIMGNAHSLARDAKRACFARVHAHWTAPCIALFEVWWLPGVTRPHVR
ncbi:hypothetical protein AB1Y20_010380 [Prymnesium parvum]|uniref:Uncharacterized protein n=1 Tax=Prymnesium parvum TaxID=97485 RepID=A0AB34IS20_PRYPA